MWLELHKPLNSSKSKPTFSIKLRMDREKVLSYTNKYFLNVCKNSGEARVNSACDNARIWIEKDKKVMI